MPLPNNSSIHTKIAKGLLDYRIQSTQLADLARSLTDADPTKYKSVLATLSVRANTLGITTHHRHVFLSDIRSGLHDNLITSSRSAKVSVPKIATALLSSVNEQLSLQKQTENAIYLRLKALNSPSPASLLDEFPA